MHRARRRRAARGPRPGLVERDGAGNRRGGGAARREHGIEVLCRQGWLSAGDAGARQSQRQHQRREFVSAADGESGDLAGGEPGGVDDLVQLLVADRRVVSADDCDGTRADAGAMADWVSDVHGNGCPASGAINSARVYQTRRLKGRAPRWTRQEAYWSALRGPILDPQQRARPFAISQLGFVLRGGPTLILRGHGRPSPQNKPTNGFQGRLPLAEGQEAEPPGP